MEFDELHGLGGVVLYLLLLPTFTTAPAAGIVGLCRGFQFFGD